MIYKLKSLRCQNMNCVNFAHMVHHLSQKCQGKSTKPHYVKEKCLQNYTLGRGAVQRWILRKMHATTSYTAHAIKNKKNMRYCT